MRVVANWIVTVAVFAGGQKPPKEWLSKNRNHLVFHTVGNRESDRWGLLFSGEMIRNAGLRPSGFPGLSWGGSYKMIWFGIRDPSPRARQVYGVLARWVIKREHKEKFEALVLANSQKTLELECGAIAFGYGGLIGRSRRGTGLKTYAEAGEYLLVECFESATGFEHHLSTEHFREFRSAVGPFFLGDSSQTTKGLGEIHLGRIGER